MIRLQIIRLKYVLLYVLMRDWSLLFRTFKKYNIWETTSVLLFIPPVLKHVNTFVELFCKYAFKYEVSWPQWPQCGGLWRHICFSVLAYLTKSCRGQVGDHTEKHLSCTSIFRNMYLLCFVPLRWEKLYLFTGNPLLQPRRNKRYFWERLPGNVSVSGLQTL